MKTDVINELQWDPAINALADRAAAQGAAWAAPGITSVVNKLVVGHRA